MHLLILWRKKKKSWESGFCAGMKRWQRGKREGEESGCAACITHLKAQTPSEAFPFNSRRWTADHNITWPCYFLSLLSRLENKGMEGCECRRLKKRNAVLKKKRKKQQHRIGFEISTLEIKSEALSAAGSMLQLVAFVEMTQHTEDTAKRYSGDRKRQDSEDKTLKYSTSLSSHYTSLYRSA